MLIRIDINGSKVWLLDGRSATRPLSFWGTYAIQHATPGRKLSPPSGCRPRRGTWPALPSIWGFDSWSETTTWYYTPLGRQHQTTVSRGASWRRRADWGSNSTGLAGYGPCYGDQPFSRHCGWSGRYGPARGHIPAATRPPERQQDRA